MDSDDANWLQWTVEADHFVTVVHISGEVDLATRMEFTAALRRGLDSPSRVVVIDLTQVSFLSSVGLRALVLTHQEAHRTDRVLRVVDGSTVVRRIFEVTGLGELLVLFPTVDEATAHLPPVVS
jgi:anti-sigma B factor antagonist